MQSLQNELNKCAQQRELYQHQTKKESQTDTARVSMQSGGGPKNDIVAEAHHQLRVTDAAIQDHVRYESKFTRAKGKAGTEALTTSGIQNTNISINKTIKSVD